MNSALLHAIRHSLADPEEPIERVVDDGTFVPDIADFWIQLEQRTGLSDVGLQAGSGFDLRRLGIVYYLMASCRDLDQVLRGVPVWVRLLASEYGVRLEISGDEARLSLYFRGTIDGDIIAQRNVRHASDFCSLVVVRTARQLVEGFSLARCQLMGPAPLEPRGHQQAFGCPVTFGAEQNLIVFPGHLLKTPIRSADPLLQTVLLPKLQQLTRAIPLDEGFIRSAYESALARGADTLHGLAEMLKTSERSLRRRLQAMGTSHRAERDRSRYELARCLLRGGDASIRQIATRVGFTDVRAFAEAFQRWSGVTPREFRVRTRRQSA